MAWRSAKTAVKRKAQRTGGGRAVRGRLASVIPAATPLRSRSRRSAENSPGCTQRVPFIREGRLLLPEQEKRPASAARCAHLYSLCHSSLFTPCSTAAFKSPACARPPITTVSASSTFSILSCLRGACWQRASPVELQSQVSSAHAKQPPAGMLPCFSGAERQWPGCSTSNTSLEPRGGKVD